MVSYAKLDRREFLAISALTSVATLLPEFVYATQSSEADRLSLEVTGDAQHGYGVAILYRGRAIARHHQGGEFSAVFQNDERSLEDRVDDWKATSWKGDGRAVREHRRRHDPRRILDTHAMVQFVLLLEAARNRNGVLDARLIDEHGLKTPFEGRVLFDVLAIFIERGGADAVQFASGQHGFEQIAGIHRAFALAGADHRVQFIDEENDFALGTRHLFQNGFQAFFEFTAILRAGNRSAHVQSDDALVLDALGHVAAHDPLRQAFDDGGLADARLADENRIVLWPAATAPE